MTLPDEFLTIDTPENVAFGYEIAGIGSRFLAALVDTILILIFQVIIFLTLFFVAGLFFDALLDEGNATFAWLLAFMGLLSFAFLWGYYIFFELLWNGQSPGKRWVGLRVIRADGTPITLTESIIRNLVRLVDFLPAYYGLGVVVMFINEQTRRLGDLAAGTLVVRDQATVTLESLSNQSTSPGLGLSSPQTTTDLPIGRLSETDFLMAEDFLRRRYELANSEELAQRIAAVLRQRMDLPSVRTNSAEAEKFIREIVRTRRGTAEKTDN